MGPVGRTSLIGRSPDLFLIDLQYIPLLPSCSSTRYQHNIPYTKIRGFGMPTSCFRISGISAMRFFLWGIPWTPKRSFWAGYWPKYVYDPDTLLLRLSPRLSIDIIAVIFLVFPIVFRRKTPFICILAQTQYGTCNSSSCVLNYYCLWSPFS